MNSNGTENLENEFKDRASVLQDKAEHQTENAGERDVRQKTASAVSSLEGMAESGRIVSMLTAGVEELPGPGGITVCLSGFLEFPGGRIKAAVPFDQVYTKEIMDMTTVDLSTPDGVRSYHARQKKMLSKILGMKINVCIKEVLPPEGDEPAGRVIASRKDACRRLMKGAFIDGQKCVEGGRYTATVMSVAPHSLALSYAGVDGVVIQALLSERYLNSLYDHYHAGDKVDFIARNIKINGDGDVTMDFCTKEAELDSFRLRSGEIPIDTLARGTISRVYRSGETMNIFAWLPDWELAAKIPYASDRNFARPLHSGDDVLLKITGYRRSGYLDARIYSVSGSAGLFSHF